jgi:hypothetical protein
MKNGWLAGLILALGLAGGALAADRPCTPAELKAAEKAADQIVNWTQLYRAYKDYGHCDTGTVSELFTEALLRCIVDWKNMEGLAKPMDQDREYRAFVYRHLGAPEAKGDLGAIHSRAKMSCPKGLDAFCAELISAVKPLQPLQAAPAPKAPAPPAPASPPAAPPKK